MLTPEPYAPYRRPPLTKEYLRGEAAREDLPIESDNWYEENGVELRLLAGVGAIDRERQTVITHKGEELSYDVCVLATGSEPVRPPVPGGDDPEILTMRTVESSTLLQDRVGEGDRAVVVGSGYIGCEAAASLSMRGAAVTLASHEQSPQRRRLGHEVGERIEGWLRDIAQAYNESAGRHLTVEHWGDALEHGRIAGMVIAGGEASWSRLPGFWSTIGDKTIKYWAWGDGWDEQVFEDEGEAFTVWYGKDGALVGVLSHGIDEDYERGRGLIESAEPF